MSEKEGTFNNEKIHLIFFLSFFAILVTVLFAIWGFVNTPMGIKYVDIFFLSTEYPTNFAMYFSHFTHESLLGHLLPNLVVFSLVIEGLVMFPLLDYKTGPEIIPRWYLVSVCLLFVIILPFTISSILLIGTPVWHPEMGHGFSGIICAMIGLLLVTISYFISQKLDYLPGFCQPLCIGLSLLFTMIMLLVLIFVDVLLGWTVFSGPHVVGLLLGTGISWVTGNIYTAQTKRRKLVWVGILCVIFILPIIIAEPMIVLV
jgi:hypothetical protein